MRIYQFIFPLALLCSVGFLLASTSACIDACEELEELCPFCSDDDTRAACEADVGRDNQTLCNERFAIYQPECREVVDGL